MNTNKDLKIVIVGAGPAGLSAAEALKEKGYTNITIIEKELRVGGMSLSLSYPPNAEQNAKSLIYELGSINIISSKNLYHLIEKHHLHLGKKSLGNLHNPNKPYYLKIYSLAQKKPLVDFTKYFSGLPACNSLAVFSDGLKLMAKMVKYRKLIQPGYHLSKEQIAELSIPYEQWVDEGNFRVMTNILKMFGSMGTFSDPAQKNEIPAIHLIKYFFQLLHPPFRYINGSIKMMAEGYQELWKRIAKEHNVLTKQITRIIRSESGVEIQFDDNNKLLADKLIVTCSPTQALKFLDVSVEEKQVFEKVHYSPGWRISFLAKNLPKDAFYAFYEPYMEPGYKPCLQSFYPEGQIDDETWLYSAVINYNKNDSLEEIKKDAEKIFQEQFNGEVIQWLTQMYWPEYTPYFRCCDVKEGVYEKMNNLQGVNNTYYSGGAFGGSSQAIVVDYSYDLINKYFE